MIIKLIKRIIPILLIILLCMTFPLNTYKVLAVPVHEDIESGTEDIEVTLENSRNQIASYAERFASTYSSMCKYSWNKRGETYLGHLPSASDPFYWFDCVGWVNFVVNRSIGLDFSLCHIGLDEGGSGFVTPQSGVRDTLHFAMIDISQAQRGDILVAPSAPHVAIFLGNGRVADMWRSSGLSIRGLSGYTMSGWTGCTFTYAARLISIDGVNFGELPGGIDINNIPEGTLTATEVNLDEIIDRMEYDGMPPDVSYDGGHSLMFYIDKVTEVFDYLIGIMFNGIKVAIVTVIDGVQSIIKSALDFLSGTNPT